MAAKWSDATRLETVPPRERLWAAMQRLSAAGPFEVSDVATKADTTMDAARDYLLGLVAAGHARCVQPGARVGARYQGSTYMLTSTLRMAPQVNKLGQPLARPQGTTAMWRAMRIRKLFDAAQIAADASVGEVTCSLATAKDYIKHLGKAGYLVQHQAARRQAHNHKLQVWRLVRDTGPIAPSITATKVVFDRNLGELVQLQTAQEVADGADA
ncbi:MAG: hypothetical protein IIZ92_00090 [Aquincola sp.]|nr:hypothetical protein [Aquincola sp.]